jgi:hypothetical protein
MTDDENARSKLVHVVSMSDLPGGHGVVTSINHADAIIKFLKKYDIICTDIMKVSEDKANCKVNDEYYFVTYYENVADIK